MLAEYGLSEYAKGVKEMSVYACKFTPWHLYETGNHSSLYAVLHDKEFIAKSKDFSKGSFLDHLPDSIRAWAHGSPGSYEIRGTAAAGVLFPPGNWFVVDEWWYLSVSVRCLSARNTLTMITIA